MVSPRPLVRDLPLVKIQMFDAGTGADIDLTEQVELSAVMELLGKRNATLSGGPVPHSNEEYPLDIKFSGGGEHWIVILGSRGGFAVDNSQKIAWRILEGGQLWQELQPPLPELEHDASPSGEGEKINMTGEVTAV